MAAERVHLDLEPEAAADLRDPGTWQPVPPKGWEPAAEVCRTTQADLDALTERTVLAITQEIAEYRSVGGPSRADLFASVYRNLEMMLLGIAEHRGPRQDELALRRDLGRRRALQGLPVQALIGAYHVGYRELWAALVREAERVGGPAPGLLLTGSATVWGWIHAVTSAVAEEYQKQIARNEAAEALAGAHFFALLTREPESDECVTLARGMGFEAEGRFRSIAVRARASDGITAPRLRSALDEHGVLAVYSERGRIGFFIVQGATEPAVKAILAAVAEKVAGIGLEREGLHGARLSVIDAERALGIASHRRSVVSFEDDWLRAIMLSLPSVVTPLFEAGSAVAGSHPHLAETVGTFARSNFSLAEAARRLHLGPTSARHRLAQWRKLTGWDPWTWDGMSRSLIAIEFAAADDGS